jgi:hypothetical protein
MVEKKDIACIVYECTCSQRHQEFDYEPEEKFIIFDQDGDPTFQCQICGVSGSHLPPITDKAEIECWRCKGTGKRKQHSYATNKDLNDVTCWSCRGTGKYKNIHRLKIIGRISKSDLIELAKKDPRGWRDGEYEW